MKKQSVTVRMTATLFLLVLLTDKSYLYNTVNSSKLFSVGLSCAVDDCVSVVTAGFGVEACHTRNVDALYVSVSLADNGNAAAVSLNLEGGQVNRVNDIAVLDVILDLVASHYSAVVFRLGG